MTLLPFPLLERPSIEPLAFFQEAQTRIDLRRERLAALTVAALVTLQLQPSTIVAPARREGTAGGAKVGKAQQGGQRTR